MKRVFVWAGLAVLVMAGSVLVQAHSQVAIPDPELKKLDVWVGHWTYEGEYAANPLGTAGKAKGEESFQWILGGYILQDLATEKGVLGEVRLAVLYAYDPVGKIIVYRGLGSDGGPITGTVKVNGNVITLEGKWILVGKEILARAVMTAAADLKSIKQKVEISLDGKTWAPFFDALYTKVKPALNTK